jgi:hypothetical protein
MSCADGKQTFSNASICLLASLAKGTESQVQSLIYYGTVDLFLKLITNENTDQRLVEICLGALKTILQYTFAPIEALHANISNLTRLIGEYQLKYTVDNEKL